MAEIHIERKSGSLWTWIISLILVVLLLAWFFNRKADQRAGAGARADSAAAFAGRSGDSAAATTAPAHATAPPDADSDSGVSPLSAFVGFATSASTASDIAQLHTFTADGIRKLADALGSGSTAAGITDKLALMREQAESLDGAAAASDRHSAIARTAFLAAADAVESLPMARDHAEPIGRVRRAAEALNAALPLADQREKIDAFFQAASNALQVVN